MYITDMHGRLSGWKDILRALKGVEFYGRLRQSIIYEYVRNSTASKDEIVSELIICSVLE